MKKIIWGDEARQKMREGAKLMFRTVGTTYGPKGRNVALSRQWGMPIIVHDGVTVSRMVQAKDEFVDQAVKLIQEAANRQVEECGDGTTLVTILTHHIIDKGISLIEAGMNPMELRKQLDALIPLVRKEIKKQTVSVKDQVDRIAAISAGDPILGKMVSDAIIKMGEDGQITVEERMGGTDTVIEYAEGMTFDKGYAHPYLITSASRAEAIVHNPAILVIGKQITLIPEIMPILEVLARINKNVVLIGEISGPALNAIVQNKLQGTIQASVINPPGHGTRRKRFMDDIALFTGGQPIVDEVVGMDIKSFAQRFDRNWIGKAESVVSTPKATTIVGGGGDKDAIAKHIEDLKAMRTKEESSFEREVYDERIAKLTTGVAVIRVGSKTEVERREKLERVKDAIGAVKSALSEEGVVAGGGVVFLKLREALKPLDKDKGRSLLYDVFSEPVKKLLENAGETPEETDKIIERIVKSGGHMGYEVNENKVKDLLESGVIDPAMVVRLAFENAVAVAGTMLTTECLIVDEIENKKEDE